MEDSEDLTSHPLDRQRRRIHSDEVSNGLQFQRGSFEPYISIDASPAATTRKLYWQGQPHLSQLATTDTVHSAIRDPIPVRISAHTLSQLSHRPSGSTEGDWILGLAIKSYIESGRRELMYVVLLDDGHEVHVARGKVEHILITGVVEDEASHPQDSGTDLQFQCHPSSVATTEGTEESSYASAMHPPNRPWPCSPQYWNQNPSIKHNEDDILSKFVPALSPSLPNVFREDWLLPTREPTSGSALLDTRLILDSTVDHSLERLPAFTDLLQHVLVDDLVMNDCASEAAHAASIPAVYKEMGSVSAASKPPLPSCRTSDYFVEELCPQAPHEAATLEESVVGDELGEGDSFVTPSTTQKRRAKASTSGITPTRMASPKAHRRSLNACSK